MKKKGDTKKLLTTLSASQKGIAIKRMPLMALVSFLLA